MKFVLFSILFNRLDNIYGIYIGSIFPLYGRSVGIFYFEYYDGETDWEFLGVHCLYRMITNKDSWQWKS